VSRFSTVRVASRGAAKALEATNTKETREVKTFMLRVIPGREKQLKV
jgi:hypothetical protein